MGIRPNRDGVIPPAQPDNPDTRYGDWLTELDSSGEIIGEVWKDTDAKASAGNSGVSDLAGRVAEIESRRCHYMTGTGSTSTTSWRTLAPAPAGWASHHTPPVEGLYRIEAWGVGLSDVSIGAPVGYGQPETIVFGTLPNHTLAVLRLGPSRRFFVRAYGDGIPLNVLIEKL